MRERPPRANRTLGLRRRRSPPRILRRQRSWPFLGAHGLQLSRAWAPPGQIYRELEMLTRCWQGGRPPCQPALEHLPGGLLGYLIGRLDRSEQPEFLVDLVEDTLTDLVVLLEELLGVLPALPESFIAVCEPGAALLDHIVLDADVEQASLAGDPLSVHHVELHRLERRRYLVLYDLDPGLVAHSVVADLERADAPDVQTYAGIELQRPPSRRRLWYEELDDACRWDAANADGGGDGQSGGWNAGASVARRGAHGHDGARVE